MKYFLGYLIKGEAREFHEDLTKKISEKFGISNITERVPAHLTLKIPFRTERIKDIEDLLSSFSRRKRASNLRLKGFGHFGRRVVFMKALAPREMEKTVGDLIYELGSIKWLNIESNDKRHNFHATLATYDIGPQFKDIWRYVSDINYDGFNLLFDNVAIFKKKDNKWLIYKEFTFSLAISDRGKYGL